LGLGKKLFEFGLEGGKCGCISEALPDNVIELGLYFFYEFDGESAFAYST